MKAVGMTGYGGVEVLQIGDHPDPLPKDDELLVRIRATALNRADLLQRRGKYPPPEGASRILGLEMAGEVVEAGSGCKGWNPGDRIMALLPGGGYAQKAAVSGGLAMRVPDNLSYEEAAAIPEAFLAAYHNLFTLGGLQAGMTVLVHAGGSGVGTAAIQLIRESEGASLVTTGSLPKINRCRELGAQAGWNYREGPFAPWVASQTEGRGVDVILDFVGAPYFEQNLQSLAADGKLIVVGAMGGAVAERVNLLDLLFRRLRILGTSLRSLTTERKIDITKRFASFALPRFADGRLIPVIDSVYDWAEVTSAHLRMESNENVGKIVLRVGEA
ncbi:MAG: NAD(P)H-quinone oxidoreductase [Deltaproteobacteria bacterium]|nr:NAD(P)H-quinone oxidoreductase [Deltaproteobacteria bacterium]